MLYQKATVENGQVKILETKVVDQSKLTSDCWMIQIEGAKACEKCEFKNKPRLCGGMKIREKYGILPVSKSKSTTVKFKWLTGDVNWMDHGGKWISSKLNNGEFDYWLVLSLDNLYNACGEREAKEMGGKYTVSLDAVAPSQVNEKDFQSAMEGWGMEDRAVSSLTDEMKVELLHSYGTHATLWYANGYNASALLKEGREHAKNEGKTNINSTLNSFANRIGHTKADFLRGDLSFETAMANRKVYEAQVA